MRVALECKVAELWTACEVVINAGHNHDVYVGQVFDIDPVEITDPDDGTYLGSVPRLGLSVEITAVHERVAIGTVRATNGYPYSDRGLTAVYPRRGTVLRSRGDLRDKPVP